MDEQKKLPKEEILKKSKRRSIWKRIVSVLACVVVFCTTYALILPAITMSKTTFCGLEEHAHSDSCYTTNLICEIETDLDADTSTSTDSAAHVHSTACYTQETKLICTIVETEGHAHTETEAISCGLTEAEAHTHGETCYENVDVLICEEQTEAQDTAASEEAATEGTEVISTETSHTHIETCYEKALACGKEIHTHTKICYSDKTADVETEADWEATLPNAAEMTGNWREDILAVAISQLGYEESTKNYEVVGDDIKGYTRYGDWYGDTYGDWCAMFVSFCLEYADVNEAAMPQDANCQNWIETLQKEQYDLYHATSTGYQPRPGDLIFFEWGDGDSNSDHVGIVVEITSDADGTLTKIKTIEGNSGDMVRYREYEAGDEEILGYGVIPATGTTVPLTEEEQVAVDEVIAMIDALPTYEEVDAKLLEYEEAEDMEGYEAYFMEVGQQARIAYEAYSSLSDNQKLFVTNVQKLNDLEWIWSAVTYSSVITSDAPTPTWYTSTRDFVELNLYDYNYRINDNWINDTKYPGFQWNGGAYAESDYKYYYANADVGIPNYITDRNRIESIDFGNSIITNFQYEGSDYAKSTTAVGVGKLYNNSGASSTGKINWLWYDGSDYGTTTNRPVGLSTGYASIATTLGSDGYPQLIDGTSLKYLFTNGSAVTKQNTESIDGLFQQNAVTGEYSYNSRINHAQYSNNFFTLYDDIITPNFITYPFGNFLPLNTINDGTKATQVSKINTTGGVQTYVNGIISDLQAAIDRDDDGNGTTADYGDTSRKQLITMLQEYKENWNWFPNYNMGDGYVDFSDLTAANAIEDYFTGGGDNPSDDTSFITNDHLKDMYNIDWDEATNFFFGMEMKMNFMMPKNGYTGNDTNGDGASDYPMVFYFTGDDDVWVYIDDVLFLDLTGIHRHVGGEIDFVNGKVHYYELDVENGGDVSDTPYKTYTFAEILTMAGKSTDVLNSNGTFKDYSTHSFNFYYMERGSGSSVCRLNFNFPLLKKNSITVTKELAPDADVETSGNPDYYFNIIKKDESNLFITPGTEYKIFDSAGNQVGTGIVDKFGIFTLKGGQSAVFENIAENSGSFYVQELIKDDDHELYAGKVDINGQNYMTYGIVNWDARDWYPGDSDGDKQLGPYGYKWHFYTSQYKDASLNSSFYIQAENGVVTENLGSLSITKKVINNLEDVSDTIYKMKVELDRQLLPAGTVYTLQDGTTKIVKESEPGFIEIKAGETATINNIISGTQYIVTEETASSEGYTVTYDVMPKEESTGGTTSATGIVRVNSNVAVTVTNSADGASVTIPGSKRVINSDGKEREVAFKLVQITNVTDHTVIEGGTVEITPPVKVNENAEFYFDLNYTGIISTNLPQYYYYKITEEESEHYALNSMEYVVEIEVSALENGEYQAAVTKVWDTKGKEIIVTEDTVLAEIIVFENTLLTNFIVEKIVTGSEVEDIFNFDVYLRTADGEPVTGNYDVTKSSATNSGKLDSVDFVEAEVTVDKETVKVGKASIQLKASEYIIIHDIPYGVKWRVIETDTEGYYVSWQTSGGSSGESNVATGTVMTENSTVNNKVVFTNEAGYELPKTGGIGTNPYIIGGLLLMIIPGFLLLYKHYKRRKEDYNAS